MSELRLHYRVFHQNGRFTFTANFLSEHGEITPVEFELGEEDSQLEEVTRLRVMLVLLDQDPTEFEILTSHNGMWWFDQSVETQIAFEDHINNFLRRN